MDLLVVPVPLFNKDIAVEAYYFRHHKGNDILQASKGTSFLDGAMYSPPLEMLNTIGVEALSMGKPMFVPIDNYMLLASLELQCSQPADKIIFLLDDEVLMDEPHLANMRRLKGLGYRFGIQKIMSVEHYIPVLDMCDFVFYDYRLIDTAEQQQLRTDMERQYKKIQAVFTHINTMDLFKGAIVQCPGCWYEGRFYRTPLTKGQTEVSPLQINQINLLNLVRDENFEFDDVAKIIQRDTALTIALLRLVNSPFIGLRNKVKTINHAVTMLGQTEVRKWITTAVSKLLGADKPNEITRLSLVRARFCEALAVKFGMEDEAQGMFLMGLFSVLDAILERPMDEALQLVHVSDVIYEALVDHKGAYYPVYEFLLQYEGANWKTVSRMLILYDVATEDVYASYVDALCWYRELLDDAPGA
ncbi:MAG: HDOD domain-containing protein [Oscillospiraceae bacterium]|jgi:EAL and modified HD-GYP domain-containing signal transduction protein|nr:HDOD domain-containing protein [Oscillospiraceae bacterium]